MEYQEVPHVFVLILFFIIILKLIKQYNISENYDEKSILTKGLKNNYKILKKTYKN